MAENKNLHLVELSGYELSKILGIQLSRIQVLSAPGKCLFSAMDKDSGLYRLGEAVVNYAKYREDYTRKQCGGELNDLRAAVEREKIYFVRQKRIADRVKIKKAIAQAMFDELYGAIVVLRSRVGEMELADQAKIAGAFEELLTALKAIKPEKVAKQAVDAVPDSDIADEIEAEFESTFPEDEESEENADGQE